MGLINILEFGWTLSRPKLVRQRRPENCVQTVLAMILGVGVEEVEKAARTQGTMTLERAMELLHLLGIEARPLEASLAAGFWTLFYDRHGRARLRGLGMRLPRDEEEGIGHAMLVYGKYIYDPATGRTDKLTVDRLEGLDWLLLLPGDMGERNMAEIKRDLALVVLS